MSRIRKLWEISLTIGPIFAVLFGVPCRSLFLGFTKYDSCPLELLLPQGLFAFGSIAAICSIIYLIVIVAYALEVDETGPYLWYFLYAYIALFIYSVSTIILAFVIAFVLRTKHAEYQSEDPSDLESFCHVSVYNFCYVFAATVITSTFMILIWFIRFWTVKLIQFLKTKLLTSETNGS